MTLHSAVKSFSWKATLDHLAFNPSKYFHKFPCHWISLKYIHLNDHFSRKWAASALFYGNFYKYCLSILGQLSLIEPPALIPLSWGIMTPNVGRLPPTIVGSGLSMLPHVCFLSTQYPPPIWPVNTFLIALLSCCPHLYLLVIKIFRITLNILDSVESSITT